MKVTIGRSAYKCCTSGTRLTYPRFSLMSAYGAFTGIIAGASLAPLMFRSRSLAP
jgi:hypothetical protein